MYININISKETEQLSESKNITTMLMLFTLTVMGLKSGSMNIWTHVDASDSVRFRIGSKYKYV